MYCMYLSSVCDLLGRRFEAHEKYAVDGRFFFSFFSYRMITYGAGFSPAFYLGSLLLVYKYKVLCALCSLRSHFQRFAHRSDKYILPLAHGYIYTLIANPFFRKMPFG